MTKKIIIIIFMAIFLFQGIMLTAADEAKKEVPKKIKNLMKKAGKYLDKAKKTEKPEKKDGYYKDAIEKYDEILKINDKFAPAYFQKSKIYSFKKDIVKTTELLEKTIVLDPNHEKAQLYLAKMYIKQGDFFKQKKKFAKMLGFYQKFTDMPNVKDKMPDDYTQKIYLIGVFNSLLKNYEKGNKYFFKLLELIKEKPKSGSYYYAIFSIALNLYDLMEIEVDKKGVRKDITKVQEVVVKYSDIEKYLVEKIKSPQDNWTEIAYFTLGKYYIYKGNKENAKKYFQDLIKMYPKSKSLNTYKTILKDRIEKK